METTRPATNGSEVNRASEKNGIALRIHSPFVFKRPGLRRAQLGMRMLGIYQRRAERRNSDRTSPGRDQFFDAATLRTSRRFVQRAGARILEARPLDRIQGKIRRRALLTISCRLRLRSASCQPTNRSQAAKFQAPAPKLSLIFQRWTVSKRLASLRPSSPTTRFPSNRRSY